MTGIHTSNTGASSSVEGTTNDWDAYVKHRSIFECRGYNQWLGYIRQTQEHLRVQRVQPMTVVKHMSIFEYRGYNQWLGYIRQTQEHLRVQRVQPMTVVKHRSIFECRGYNQWLGYIRQTQEYLRVQRVQPMTGIHTSNTGASSSTEGTTNDWDTYVKHRSIFEYRGYNQWLGYIRQTQEHLRVQRVQPMTVVKHMSIFEYRGYNQWLGYIRQTQEYLRVQRVQPMTGIHTSNTGASSSTEGTTNDWDTYVKHRSIFECRGYNQWLGYIRQTQVLEDAPVFDVCIPVIGCTLCTRRYSCVWRMYPSHWLYPLYSKMLLCLTNVSQSLVVPSALEDTPVFDVCIPVIGCTLCTRRCSCVWRMYPRHWLYPLHSKMLLCLTTVIGCTLCTLRYSCVWRMYPSHWLYHLYSKILLCLTYVSQSLVVPSVLEDTPVFDVCIPDIGCTLWASSSTEGTTNDWDTYVKHRSILECRGYNQWLSSNTGAS